MNPPSSTVACLSLAPNLRCVPLNNIQIDILIIPPAIELVFCVALIFLKWGSGRAHLLLATDGVFYFILALVDLLSRVIPAARSSTTTFKAMDIFIGSVSFIPVILYTSYLSWLSYREFITSLPPRHRSMFKYLLIILISMIIASNEVASFVGVSFWHLPDSRASLVFDFTNNNELLWLNLSRLSLALYATIQILFFFLAFYRLIGAFRGQQRIESTLDKHHRFNGIGWITVGIMLGVIESIVGFATGGFAVPLSRRILRLTARSSLIIGVLKGVDSHETFEYLANKLPTWRRSMSLSSSNSWMVNRRFSRQASQRSHPSQEPSPTEKVVKGITGGQRVTVHYGTDQAPFLQIRFSTLNFPEPAVVADDNGVQSRTRSSLDPCDDLSQMYADQNTSAEIPTSRRHFKGNAMRESGYTISDNMSLVRELSLRFPLPPRVTGKYRGSILGQKYSDDDDEFPLVGISRGPSIRRDITQGAVAGNGNGVLSSNTGSIKRKPAPLLLHIPQPARTRERLVSSWGGLDTPNSLEYTSQSPATPSWPRPSVGSPLSTNMGDDEGCGTPQPRPRQLTPRRLFHHASRALSVVSIRSAEWLSSARPQPSSRPTPASIEAYYNGGTAIGPRRTYADPNDVRSSESGEGDDHRRSTDHDAALPGTPQSQIITHMSIGQVHTRMTPTPTLAQFPLGREPIASTYGEVQGWN